MRIFGNPTRDAQSPHFPSLDSKSHAGNAEPLPQFFFGVFPVQDFNPASHQIGLGFA